MWTIIAVAGLLLGGLSLAVWNRRREESDREFAERKRREKAAALGQMYGMGDVKTGLRVGEYPPRDYAAERASGVRNRPIKAKKSQGISDKWDDLPEYRGDSFVLDDPLYSPEPSPSYDPTPTPSPFESGGGSFGGGGSSGGWDSGSSGSSYDSGSSSSSDGGSSCGGGGD